MSRAAAKPKAPAPMRSGWCNPANPPASHDHCLMEGCICAHHQPPPEPEPAAVVAVPAGISDEAMLRFSLTETANMLAELDDDTLRLKTITDFDTALELLQHATALAAEAKRIAGTFHDRAWALRGAVYGDHHHPSLGIVSVRRTAKKERWDHDGLGQRVVDAHLTATEGEMPDPTEVARWLLEAAAPSYWRKTVLKPLGIDAEGEDLYTKERGNPAISFPSASTH